MANTMKKTLFYNFFPTKIDEINATLTQTPHQVTPTIIEIRDDNPNFTPNFDPTSDPWRIRKQLNSDELSTGKIQLSLDDVFKHVFRYCALESANNVVTGKKVYVTVYDVTDENAPMQYGPYDEHTFFEKGLNDGCYVLGLNVALIKSRELTKGDEIGIYYDPRSQCFYFKVFR